jgi:sulfite reductase (NADPH) flavoprotein alpha-component
MHATPNHSNQASGAPWAISIDPQIQTLLRPLDRDSLCWLSGYTAALALSKPGADANAIELLATAATVHQDASQHSPSEAAIQSAETNVLTVLYGSQTGNSQRIAQELAGKLEAQGNRVRLVRADEYSLKQLKAERFLWVVISTQGDGDPPEDARVFVQQLLSTRAPQLPELQFAVLGLGDSSYPKFNHTAIGISERLKALGATALMDTALADVQIDAIAQPWQQHSLARAQQFVLLKPSNVTPLHVTTLALRSKTEPRAATAFAAANHVQPIVQATVLCNQRITSPQSSKNIRHLELAIEGTGLRYQPGDSLLVHAENADALVDEIMQVQTWHGARAEELRNALKSKKEITRMGRPTLKLLAERGQSGRLSALLHADQQPALARYLQTTQLIDALIEANASVSAEELLASLPELKPRAYSIASAQTSVGEEVHLTVAHVHYQHLGQHLDQHPGKARFGLVSTALTAAKADQSLRVQLEPNPRFRLGADSQDIIMIGPGTGVAPFRAFIQERAETGASGRNWLFFGNPTFRHDFLYQLEWQRALKNKQLHRVDVAFSRDGPHKVYVQQRLREQARELYAWLESGASIYLCGDAKAMAKDVEAALLEVIASQSAKDADFAQDYLNELSANKRFQRDVY